MTLKHVARAASLFVVLLVAGCAASGPRFVPVEAVPQEKALVYIYRNNSIVGGAIRYHVSVGDEPIVHLIRGGYYPYLADPGETTFWAKTEAREEITEYLQAGRTYYLRGSVGMGVVAGRPRFTFEPEDVGAAQVAKCVLLPRAEAKTSEP